MTALLPQQMRELADLGPLIHIESWDTVCAALRAAADQLEAVRALAEVMSDMGTTDEAALAGKTLAILNADTAPQEDRDDAR